MAYSIPTCNTISVKLDDTNYPAWGFLMHHHLRGHRLLKFVDGSHLCPPQFLVGDDSSLVNNYAAREKWMQQDSLVISMLSTTLSADALTLVVGCETSLEVWLTLKQRYAIVSEPHIMRLKAALHNIQKGYDSIDKYLLRFKYIRDRLAVAGVEMNDQDAKFLILAGLPIQYGSTRQIIRGQKGINMEEVRSLLLTAKFEIELQNKTSSLSTLVTHNGLVNHRAQNFPFGINTAAQSQSLYPFVNCCPVPSSMLPSINGMSHSSTGAYDFAPQNANIKIQNGGNHGVTQNDYGNMHQYNVSSTLSEEVKEIVVRSVQESIHTEKYGMVESVVHDEKMATNTRIPCSAPAVVLGVETLLDEKINSNGIEMGSVEESVSPPQKISKSDFHGHIYGIQPPLACVGPKALFATICTQPLSPCIATQQENSDFESQLKPQVSPPATPLSVHVHPQLHQPLHKTIEGSLTPKATLARYLMSCRHAWKPSQMWQSLPVIHPG